MTWQGWFTVATLGGVLGTLALTGLSADAVMLAALVVLMTAGILTPEAALGGFSNEGMITVGFLFVVAAAIRETGGLNALTQHVLGRPRSVTAAQARLMFPVAAISAFMNNTPLVAMMLPLVSDWAKKHRLSVSKVMMPLSFATILGGLCSLIGTSTNVVVNGLMKKQMGHGLGMFDIAWVGLPAALVGLTYMLVASRWLLRDRRPAISSQDDPRSYTIEMMVEAGSGLVGRSIEEAGLRHLSGMYLMEIDRNGQIMTAVPPETRLAGGDRLIFVGVVESVVDLQKIRGLAPATNQVFKLDAPRAQRTLVEAVVSDTCPLVGKSIREGRFRSHYNAAVIAVSRNGERIHRKIGDIVLRPGDTLLLEAHPSFVSHQRNSRDFFLVSQVEGAALPRHDRAWLAVAILVGMVAAMAFSWLSEVNAAMVAATVMIATGCCSVAVARRAVDWNVLLVIGASFGLGRAMQATGADRALADLLIGFAGTHPHAVLVATYLMTMILTEMMSNNSAAVLSFPIALATADRLGVNPMPFIMSLTVAASCGFATPIGYQTNLMVYGPGGYRFGDYVRFGGILNLLVGIVTVLVAPLVWPF